MPQPEPSNVTQAIEQLIEFLTRFGEQTLVTRLRLLAARLGRDGFTGDLSREIDACKDEILLQTRESIFAGRMLPGKTGDETQRELLESTGALFNALHALDAQPADLDISAFPGAEHVEHTAVLCRGNPSRAPAVVECSIALARRYSEALARGDFESAYAMTDAGLRAAMDFADFVDGHRQAERRYGGPVLELRIERLAYVLTDEEARRHSATGPEGWFKGTSKENRRCRLVGFCVRDRTTQHGCRAALWVSEENGEYRIANFDFYSD